MDPTLPARTAPADSPAGGASRGTSGPRAWRAIGARGALAACVVVGGSGLLPSIAQAQPAIPAGLASGGVAVVDGHVFARARAPMRDPQAPLQSLLATRASFYAARWLCQYTPTPDTRLEAPLGGVSVVESKTEGDQLTVTIRLPLQRPDCVVRALPPQQQLVPESPEANASSAYPTLAPYVAPPGASPRPSEIN